MKDKKRGLVARISAIVCLTSILIFVATSVAGAFFIYSITEESVENEIEYAATTLSNLYDKMFEGEFEYKNAILTKGGEIMDDATFYRMISIIGCEGVDFTLFWHDTRMLTSIRKDDGTRVVGTQASAEVSKNVLTDGKAYFYKRVLVNGKNYLGYYIPFFNNDGDAVGMFFAGKTLDNAFRNAGNIVGIFLLIDGLVLVVSLVSSHLYARRLVNSLLDIRDFMARLSDCDFSSGLNEKTLNRKDEIAVIARTADKVSRNLRELIERDPLTLLFNRRSGRRIMDELTEEGAGYCVAMGDIDYFKSVNDRFGHACGDTVLTEVSAILRDGVSRCGGSAARWGGEEFLLIFPNCGCEQAKQILVEILGEIRRTSFSDGNTEFFVTMTFGVSQSAAGEAPDCVVNRADALLYDGKQSGRNRIVDSRETIF